jgi:MoxR-like ATPase
MEGTYPLPEAQLDRFFFKVDVPFPTEAELMEIMARTTGAERITVNRAATGADIIAMQTLARDVPIASHVMAYAVRILRASHPDSESPPELVRKYVRYGGSPRGAQAMVLGGKIHALLDGRFNVAFSDVQAVAAPGLRHRIILSFEERPRGSRSDGVVRAIIAGRHRIGPVGGDDRAGRAAADAAGAADVLFDEGVPAPPGAARAGLPAAERPDG